MDEWTNGQMDGNGQPQNGQQANGQQQNGQMDTIIFSKLVRS